MNLRLTLAIAAGKTAGFLVRTSGSGGTAAPGLLALKIQPRLVKLLAAGLKQNIIVTGTNGKTTTCRMLSAICRQNHTKIIHNRAGSNLTRGIASTLIDNCTFFGNLQAEWGIWETDEAAFAEIAGLLKPNAVLITNLFRDQLDRYGEIDNLAKVWSKTLGKLPKNCKIYLNADDATVAFLGQGLSNQVFYYGIELAGKNYQQDHTGDANICPSCQSKLSYQRCYVGHLGKYTCINCGHIQPKKDYCLTCKNDSPELMIGNQHLELKHKLPGSYNLYNCLASAVLANHLQIPLAKIGQGLENFTPAFGRVEKIKYKDKIIHIYLIKNPTGTNEVIKTLISQRKNLTALVAINDLIADGRDISWLWDVNFEKLTPLKKAIISGSRAHDMALRLKYCHAKNKSNNLIIEPDFAKAVNLLLDQPSRNLFILPTYTAMLQIRKILGRLGLVKPSWQD